MKRVWGGEGNGRGNKSGRGGDGDRETGGGETLICYHTKREYVLCTCMKTGNGRIVRVDYQLFDKVVCWLRPTLDFDWREIRMLSKPFRRQFLHQGSAWRAQVRVGYGGSGCHAGGDNANSVFVLTNGPSQSTSSWPMNGLCRTTVKLNRLMLVRRPGVASLLLEKKAFLFRPENKQT